MDVSLGEYISTEEDPIMCEKAVAVDKALETLVSKGQNVEISSTFIKKWALKAREFGGSLSAKRFQMALRKMELKVSVTTCGQQHMSSAGWVVNIGKEVIPSPPHTNKVRGTKNMEKHEVEILYSSP